MSLTRPPVREAKPFADAIGYNTPFILDGIRVVEANSREYGKGKMVVIDARGQSEELTIWGVYLVAQAEAVEDSDLGHRYLITETHRVAAFSQRPVKALLPCDADGNVVEEADF